jgi:hypothetical protein
MESVMFTAEFHTESVISTAEYQSPELILLYDRARAEYMLLNVRHQISPAVNLSPYVYCCVSEFRISGSGALV